MNNKDFLQYSSNLSVLFIENDNKIRNQFSEILKLFFHRVDVAADGISGLHQFREFYFDTDHYYDIVITEVDMPVMGGEQLIKEIKLINKTQPVVVISNNNESESLIRFIKLGIKDFLQKPLCTTELQDSLYQLSKSISLTKVPDMNYGTITKENKEPNNNIEFLRYDDSICLSKLI